MKLRLVNERGETVKDWNISEYHDGGRWIGSASGLAMSIRMAIESEAKTEKQRRDKAKPA